MGDDEAATEKMANMLNVATEKMTPMNATEEITV